MDIELEKWFRSWDAAQAQVLHVSEKVLNEVAAKLYTKIVSYTPVGDPSLWKYPAPAGYQPGTLKKAWEIEFSKQEVTISNDEPYALRVEYGWSSQAPNGMMRRGIATFPDLLEQAAQRYKF